MNTELTYSTPEDEGVSSEYIINFLNEMEKREAEIHGIMILKNNKVIFEAYNEPYRNEIPHIVHSFTKCFTNTAVGIAYTKGLIKRIRCLIIFRNTGREQMSIFRSLQYGIYLRCAVVRKEV